MYSSKRDLYTLVKETYVLYYGIQYMYLYMHPCIRVSVLCFLMYPYVCLYVCLHVCLYVCPYMLHINLCALNTEEQANPAADAGEVLCVLICVLMCVFLSNTSTSAL